MYVAANDTQHDIDWNYQSEYGGIEQKYSSGEIRDRTATRWELTSIFGDSSVSPIHATGSICSFANEPNNSEVVCTVSHDTKFVDLYWSDRVQDSVELEYYNYE
ncbi:hypothetical protein [Haloarchaeobius baliensis]|uniref:hypothetical protein n=1 Tax=Haloarchaeobius baliensis TaxID=1670458 RepID=UPI003F885803